MPNSRAGPLNAADCPNSTSSGDTPVVSGIAVGPSDAGGAVTAAIAGVSVAAGAAPSAPQPTASAANIASATAAPRNARRPPNATKPAGPLIQPIRIADLSSLGRARPPRYRIAPIR